MNVVKGSLGLTDVEAIPDVTNASWSKLGADKTEELIYLVSSSALL
jgi:hypothetical protein